MSRPMALAESLDTRKRDSLPSELPKMPPKVCSKDNPNVWPYDHHPVTRYTNGFTKSKQFPNCVCKVCKKKHPSAFHDICKGLFEVWTYKHSPGRCAARQCGNRDSHTTVACGLGEFRDHPENPELPPELEQFHRPWPKDARLVPLPLFYLKGIGERPSPDLPNLPERWNEGFHHGFWDKKQGLHYSVELQAAKCSGTKSPDFNPEIHLSDKVIFKDQGASKQAPDPDTWVDGSQGDGGWGDPPGRVGLPGTVW